MKTEKQLKEHINYWQITARHDYETMLGLFKIKRYSDALFFGHIVLEKILKALVVKATKKEAPKIHDLVRLGKLSEIDLTLDEWESLKMVNRFNMRTRYPDIKFQFYKLSDAKYTKENLDKIVKIYKKLCLLLK